MDDYVTPGMIRKIIDQQNREMAENLRRVFGSASEQYVRQEALEDALTSKPGDTIVACPYWKNPG